jgi:hypothetical protein
MVEPFSETRLWRPSSGGIAITYSRQNGTNSRTCSHGSIMTTYCLEYGNIFNKHWNFNAGLRENYFKKTTDFSHPKIKARTIPKEHHVNQMKMHRWTLYTSIPSICTLYKVSNLKVVISVNNKNAVKTVYLFSFKEAPNCPERDSTVAVRPTLFVSEKYCTMYRLKWGHLTFERTQHFCVMIMSSTGISKVQVT